jgi:arsenite methyltransferase
MLTPAMPSPLNVESAVRNRYTAAAQQRVDALCCPIDYDPRFLEAIPAEVLERDYGCGDPSRHLRAGETVLDLGSGAGKICFIAAQVVGPTGKVIGVDSNDDMLALARKHQKTVGDRIGYHNVEFRKGRIQDLGLDLERLDAELKNRPLDCANASLAAESVVVDLRLRSPLVASQTIDVVVSNCVLNLVDPQAKPQLFAELFRVLKIDGRAVISDIVSDRNVSPEMERDPELWSGCISGALTEQRFLEAFAEAGFYGIRVLKLEPRPWRTVQGIEFRSITVEAFKGRPDEGGDRKRAVIYKGPFKEVLDDEQHRMERGRRCAVSDKTYERLQKSPYRECFEFIESSVPVAPQGTRSLDPGERLADPKQSKAQESQVSGGISQCCDGTSCC